MPKREAVWLDDVLEVLDGVLSWDDPAMIALFRKLPRATTAADRLAEASNARWEYTEVYFNYEALGYEGKPLDPEAAHNAFQLLDMAEQWWKDEVLAYRAETEGR